jgi:REP element-mobilizing transposase RayT
LKCKYHAGILRHLGVRTVGAVDYSAKEGHRVGAPLGYLLTWTTYGSWLPGDRRGWVDKRNAAWHVPFQEPDPCREVAARGRMKEPPVVLDRCQRQAVMRAISEVCRFRGWVLHAVSVRSNHVHVVLSPGDCPPKPVIATLKAYATRALRKTCPDEDRWWTEGGSGRFLNDERSFLAAVGYVNSQDLKWMMRQ